MTSSEAANKPTATAAKPPPITTPAVPAPIRRCWCGKALPRRCPVVQDEGPWWLCSFVFHLVLVCSLALIGAQAVAERSSSEAPSFEEAKVEDGSDAPKEIERFEVGETPEDPTELSTDTLTLEKPAQMAQEREVQRRQPEFHEHGRRHGRRPATSRTSAASAGSTSRDSAPARPSRARRRGRGRGQPAPIPAAAATAGASADAAPAAARPCWPAAAAPGNRSGPWPPRSNWLARHQVARRQLEPGRLTRPAARTPRAPARHEPATSAAATAPWPAAVPGRRTNARDQGPVQADHRRRHLLSCRATSRPTAICAWHGHHVRPRPGRHRPVRMLRHDRRQARAARGPGGIELHRRGQDPRGGGWRYDPRKPGDTSVTGWQVMALKSGQMADLNVSPARLREGQEVPRFRGGVGATRPPATAATSAIPTGQRRRQDQPGHARPRSVCSATNIWACRGPIRR